MSQQRSPGSGDRREKRRPILIAAVVSVLAAPALAQEASSLRGEVSPDGPAADVQVVAVDLDSGYRRSVGVRGDGTYHFPSLRPGRYRLELATPDGTWSAGEVTLRVGQSAVLDLDFTGPPAAVADAPGATEEIVVVGRRIRTQEGGEVGVNLTPELIESLPQNNRNFLAFADLAPGVSFERDGNGATRIQGGAQHSRTVNVFIDGVSQKDYVLKNGITGQDSSPGNPFPQSAISEYRVISQNYKAEFSQVSSAAITAVTRSGTNEFRGDVFSDYTNEGLRSETPRELDLGEAKVQTTDHQFGLSFGGPIVQDRLHFFTAYEGKRNEIPVEVSPGAGLVATDLPARYADLIGVYNRRFDEDLYFVKLDFLATEDNLFQFSVKVRQETGRRWDNGPNAPSFTHDINNDETRVLLRYERAATSWINDVRLTFEDSAWNPQPLRQNAAILELSGRQVILNVGGHPNFQDKGQSGWGLQDDLTWTRFADHIVKTGVSLKRVELATVQQLPYNAQYFYNTEFDHDGTGAFNDTVPYRLTFGAPLEGIGDGSARSDNVQLGIYIQDDWLVTSRLELNLGLRWDYEETPVYLDHITPADAATALRAWPNIESTNYDIEDFISNGVNRDAFTDAFQPRLGFSFDLTEGGRYTLFGGYGRSYDRTQFDFVQLESTAQTFQRHTFDFDTGDPDNPCAGCPAWDPVYLTATGRAELLAGAAGGSREIFLLSNDLKVPYANQLSVGIRGRFNFYDAELGLSRIEARDGFAWLLGNRRDDGSFFAPGATWGQPWGFTPPGFSNVLLGTNGIESNADSFYLRTSRVFDDASRWGFHATYTYTDATQNRPYGGTFALDYPSIGAYPRLTSSGVTKHRFVVAGNVALPWGLALSGKLTYRSPPYVYGIGRPGDPNDQRAPRVIEAADNFRQLDVAIVKSVDLPDFAARDSLFRIRFDVINLLDEENFSAFIGNGTSQNFGAVNNFGIGGNLPRTVKLSVGLTF